MFNSGQLVDIEEVKKIVLDAGNLFFDRNGASQTTEKGLADYVTQVDYAVQNYIYEKLMERYPEYQFMGEEGHNHTVNYDNTFWILDPVDGTTNLIHDYQNSAISLALVDNYEIVLGIVYNPFHNELFWAKKGEGCFLNGKRVVVSSANNLCDSLIAIGTSPYYKELAEENFRLYKELFIRVQDIRRSGSAALDMAYVACGRLDAYMEKKLKLWDYAAGLLLIKEAGGVVVNHDGSEVGVGFENDILAGNPQVTYQVVNLMNDL